MANPQTILSGSLLKRLKNFFKRRLHIIFLIINQYSRVDKIKLIFIVAIQFFLAFFDLIGIFLIGILGSVTIYGVQSKNVGVRTSKVLELLNIESFSFHQQVVFLASLAFFFLFAKTLLSGYLTKRILFFLSIKGSVLSGKLIKSIFLSNPHEVIQHRKLDLVHAVTIGIDGISTRIVATGVTLFSDFTLLTILFLGMLVINPLTTFIAFLIFGFTSIGLGKVLKGKAFRIGQEEMQMAMKSNREILEGLNTYNELYIHDLQNQYAEKISQTRYLLGTLAAGRSMLPVLSKLFFELSLLVGTMLVSAIQFLVYDATYAIAGLAIFFAAASRIAPALLRIQQNLTTIRGALGSSEFTIELLEKFNLETLDIQNKIFKIHEKHFDKFVSKVELIGVGFDYGNYRNFSFSNLSLSMEEGSFNAIIGPSGSGKSSLVSLILGINKPKMGQVLISGTSPHDAFQKWPGECSYVPQNGHLIEGTIEENIALGFSKGQINKKQIYKAIDMANLREFIDRLPLKEKTYINEEGKSISGGQKQRLILARALYTNPKLLILDEATSALDLESEHQISEVLQNLKGKITLVVIAHRLNSIKNADNIIYLSEGKIVVTGTFTEVSNVIPNFVQSGDLFEIDSNQ